jgi:hypothetical protein
MTGPPALDDLLRVQAVGSTQILDGAEVSLLSVEFYADGFVLTLRARPRGTHQNWSAVPPRETATGFEIQISDDAGGTYHRWPLHWTSKGEAWRFLESFAPAVSGDATTLEVRIDAVTLRRHAGSGAVYEARIPGSIFFKLVLT